MLALVPGWGRAFGGDLGYLGREQCWLPGGWGLVSSAGQQGDWSTCWPKLVSDGRARSLISQRVVPQDHILSEEGGDTEVRDDRGHQGRRYINGGQRTRGVPWTC